MDPYEEREVERRLAFLELLLAAQDRRHEVVHAVWAEVARLRDLVNEGRS
jgi:hypothetical protein